MLKILKIAFFSFITCLLFACATNNKKAVTPAQLSELQQGKRFFEGGYYKSAMKELLPLACDGSAEAQYAVGYMYYYGYGVAQDTDVGYFWIKRSANKGFAPAAQALSLIAKGEGVKPIVKKKLRYPSESLQDGEEKALYY